MQFLYPPSHNPGSGKKHHGISADAVGQIIQKNVEKNGEQLTNEEIWAVVSDDVAVKSMFDCCCLCIGRELGDQETIQLARTLIDQLRNNKNDVRLAGHDENGRSMTMSLFDGTDGIYAAFGPNAPVKILDGCKLKSSMSGNVSLEISDSNPSGESTTAACSTVTARQPALHQHQQVSTTASSTTATFGRASSQQIAPIANPRPETNYKSLIDNKIQEYKELREFRIKVFKQKGKTENLHLVVLEADNIQYPELRDAAVAECQKLQPNVGTDQMRSYFKQKFEEKIGYLPANAEEDDYQRMMRALENMHAVVIASQIQSINAYAEALHETRGSVEKPRTNGSPSTRLNEKTQLISVSTEEPNAKHKKSKVDKFLGYTKKKLHGKK